VRGFRTWSPRPVPNRIRPNQGPVPGRPRPLLSPNIAPRAFAPTNDPGCTKGNRHCWRRRRGGCAVFIAPELSRISGVTAHVAVPGHERGRTPLVPDPRSPSARTDVRLSWPHIDQAGTAVRRYAACATACFLRRRCVNAHGQPLVRKRQFPLDRRRPEAMMSRSSPPCGNRAAATVGSRSTPPRDRPSTTSPTDEPAPRCSTGLPALRPRRPRPQKPPYHVPPGPGAARPVMGQTLTNENEPRPRAASELERPRRSSLDPALPSWRAPASPLPTVPLAVPARLAAAPGTVI